MYINDCYYCVEFDDVCVNDASPYCATWCPVTEYPQVCRFYAARKESNNDEE